jgi:uncharacterized membrane protein
MSFRSDEDLPLATTSKTDFGNLDNNVAALLCYTPLAAINIIAPIVWLKTEKKTNTVLRFHSMQALVLTGAYIAASIVLFVGGLILSVIPVFGLFAAITHLISGCLTLGYLVVNIWMMVQAYKRRVIRLPMIADIADNLVK